jgi:hypothetical protein
MHMQYYTILYGMKFAKFCVTSNEKIKRQHENRIVCASALWRLISDFTNKAFDITASEFWKKRNNRETIGILRTQGSVLRVFMSKKMLKIST